MTQVEYDIEMKRLNEEKAAAKQVFLVQMAELDEQKRKLIQQENELLMQLHDLKTKRTNCLLAVKQINIEYENKKHQLHVDYRSNDTEGMA